MEDKYIEKIIETEARAKSNTNRLDEHDQQIKELSNVYVALTKVDNKVENVNTKVDTIEKDVKDIKEKPAKKWDSLISTLITCIATAIAGYFLAKFGM